MILEAVNQKENIRLVIEHDEAVGYYLYVYPIGSNVSIADYLCDDIDEAFLEAEKRYHVTKEKFIECKS